MRKMRPLPAVLTLPFFIIVLGATKARCQEYSWGGDTAAQIGETLAMKRPLTVDRSGPAARPSDAAFPTSRVSSFTGGEPEDFERYINGQPSHYDYHQVLITGVGVTQDHITPTERKLFDRIITLSPSGNSTADYVRAGVAHTLRVSTVNGAFEGLKGKNIERMVVHSWAYAEVKNQIDLGSFKVKEIVAIDGAGSRWDNWRPPVGTKVEKYYDPQGFVPNVPPISLSQVTENTPGLKLTIPLGAGGRANHSAIPGIGHARVAWEQVLIDRGSPGLGPRGLGMPAMGVSHPNSFRLNSQGPGGLSGPYRPGQSFGAGSIRSLDRRR